MFPILQRTPSQVTYHSAAQDELEGLLSRAKLLRDQAINLADERVLLTKTVQRQVESLKEAKLQSTDLADLLAIGKAALDVLQGVTVNVDEEAGMDAGQIEAKKAVGAKMMAMEEAVENARAAADVGALEAGLDKLRAMHNAALPEPNGPTDERFQSLILGCAREAQRSARRRLGELVKSAEAALEEVRSLEPEQQLARQQLAAALAARLKQKAARDHADQPNQDQDENMQPPSPQADSSNEPSQTTSSKGNGRSGGKGVQKQQQQRRPSSTAGSKVDVDGATDDAGMIHTDDTDRSTVTTEDKAAKSQRQQPKASSAATGGRSAPQPALPPRIPATGQAGHSTIDGRAATSATGGSQQQQPKKQQKRKQGQPQGAYGDRDSAYGGHGAAAQFWPGFPFFSGSTGVGVGPHAHDDDDDDAAGDFHREGEDVDLEEADVHVDDGQDVCRGGDSHRGRQYRYRGQQPQQKQPQQASQYYADPYSAFASMFGAQQQQPQKQQPRPSPHAQQRRPGTAGSRTQAPTEGARGAHVARRNLYAHPDRYPHGHPAHQQQYASDGDENEEEEVDVGASVDGGDGDHGDHGDHGEEFDDELGGIPFGYGRGGAGPVGRGGYRYPVHDAQGHSTARSPGGAGDYAGAGGRVPRATAAPAGARRAATGQRQDAAAAPPQARPPRLQQQEYPPQGFGGYGGGYPAGIFPSGLDALFGGPATGAGAGRRSASGGAVPASRGMGAGGGGMNPFAAFGGGFGW